jgi:hypothetical protein
MSEASPKGKAHGCAALKPLPIMLQIIKNRKKNKKAIRAYSAELI